MLKLLESKNDEKHAYPADFLLQIASRRCKVLSELRKSEK